MERQDTRTPKVERLASEQPEELTAEQAERACGGGKTFYIFVVGPGGRGASENGDLSFS